MRCFGDEEFCKDPETKRREEEEAKKKAEEEEAKKKAEEDAKKKAEEDAKRKADAEAKRKAEADAKRKADEEARRRADAKRKADEDARRRGGSGGRPNAAGPQSREDFERQQRLDAELAKRRRQQEEYEREKAAHDQRAEQRRQNQREFQAAQAGYAAGMTGMMVGNDRYHYRGASWRLSLFGGLGYYQLPVVANESLRSPVLADRDYSLADTAMAPTMWATLGLWPYFNASGIAFGAFGSAGYGYYGDANVSLQTGWLLGGGRLRLGSRSLALFAEYAQGWRWGQITRDTFFFTGDRIYGGASETYGLRRYGGGVQICFTNLGRKDIDCFIGMDLAYLREEPDFTERTVHVARFDLWMVKGAFLRVEGGIDYPRAGAAMFAPDASVETDGMYLDVSVGVAMNIIGDPY